MGNNKSDFSELEKQIEELKIKVDKLSKNKGSNKLSMIVFSGDLDRALTAFIIATGATAMGMEVVMFFTFWRTPILRDEKKKVFGKDFMSNMFGFMLPKGSKKVKLSKNEHGRNGNHHDEGINEKKECSFP